jgi:hypothetical protein
MATNTTTLEVGPREGWLWEAAGKIRGAIDASKQSTKYKDFLLPRKAMALIPCTG